MGRFEGKVVGITGAASPAGIGFHIAEKMLAEGAQVFICDLKQDAVDNAVSLLAESGSVKGYSADVSDEKSVHEMFNKAIHDFGKIDVFVSNAGIYPQSLLMDMSVDQWNQVMAVNLRSVFICAKEVYEVMKNTGGVLINAASYAAVLGSSGSGAYAASKSAVYSLTKTLAAEFAPYGIRVCGYIPGVIQTKMTQSVVDKNGKSMVEAIALNRLGKPEDVANAVAFLASDEASYLTGTFIEVSGGKLCVQNPNYHWKVKAERDGE